MKHRTFQGEVYQQQGDVYLNDGRENALLHFAYNHPKIERMRGNPKKVLEAIDEYARTQKSLMNIGPYKARTAAGGMRYFSLEINPEFGAVISMLVDLAGLRDIVTVVIGASSDSLKRLHSEGKLGRIDLLFLDHYKPAYTMDLKLCEELGLVGPGSVYVADNVVKPGNPPYLEYVSSTVEQKRRSSRNADRATLKGNPNLLYETEFIEGWEPSSEPDALEIARCIRVEE
ncbi:hypothetical protein DL768_006937 [Monosporascus sp. mg162]|nr:hypothetical protein DL768_006937 [Monosporascus sp. mg162]